MSKYIISFGLLFGTEADKLFGQTSIQLDRPDQTECPFIVPAKYIQLENGFNFENVNSGISSFSYPATLWKYGVNERFELRLTTEFVTEATDEKTVSGIMPVTIGFKANLCKEKGIIPTTSFIGHLTTSDLGSEKFHTTYVAPAFRFTMQHTLSERFSLAYNLGAEWDGETAAQTYIYTLATGFSINEKLGCYAELYGYAPAGSKPDHRCDGGFTYLINNDFIIDLSGGVGLTNNAPDNYVSLGISYRFKTTKK